ncbi:hypothetical protein HGB24_01475 [Candidatus Saccharibacteria bacterium]|nr:hypothetical protein [Candidatus Saccharibacteria bacterium]
MTVSIVFSIALYHMASNELDARLVHFQTNIQRGYEIMPGLNFNESLRLEQEDQANANLSINLIYANLFVLVAGGLGSYLLARRTLEPIEKAHESQSRFTSDASHELRTPLAAMKMEMEVALRDKNATAMELKEVISSNLEEVNKLSKLSEMLLNLSRLDHDKLSTETTDLFKITKVVVADFNQNKHRLEIVNGKKLHLKANEMAISELVKILIDNALLYSPQDSLVAIRLSKPDKNHVTFEITNSGSGISGDKLPYIFDRFYRADASRTNGPKRGFGLGLALAKRIVELHGGEISVESIPNEKTIFTFTLPTNNDFQAKPKN